MLPTSDSASLPIDPNMRLGDLSGTVIDGSELTRAIEDLSRQLVRQLPRGSLVGLYADNGVDWVMADLVLQQAGMVSIPIPGFFTPSQISHLLTHHPVRAIVAPMLPPALAAAGFSTTDALVKLGSLMLFIRDLPPDSTPALPPGAKLTFTSGSTGDPKGIALSAARQWQVAESLASTLRPLAVRRHLAMLPMSVLLENVAGLYTALRLGAEVVLLPLSAVGLSQSSSFNARQALNTIIASETESLILLPQMLRDLVVELQSTGRSVDKLKFVAVGGGKVADKLIIEGRELGLPVFEGYGLSETCSVVSLNTPAADRIGSVGRPLPHHSVRIASDGEIEVSQPDSSWFATGDLGTIDADGYLTVTGRKKNILITSFGRNVSPEWPESVLQSFPEIAQVMVYGDAQPRLSALIVPSHADCAQQKIQHIIDQANQALPDYARIGQWHVLDKAFSPMDGTLTANGRPRREKIAEIYQSLINS